MNTELHEQLLNLFDTVCWPLAPGLSFSDGRLLGGSLLCRRWRWLVSFVSRRITCAVMITCIIAIIVIVVILRWSTAEVPFFPPLKTSKGDNFAHTPYFSKIQLFRPTIVTEYQSLDVLFRELPRRRRRAAPALGHDETD